MNVETLLATAKNCKTDDDVHSLLDTLVEMFCNNEHFSKLGRSNSEAYMDELRPYLAFELNHVISKRFITSIRLTIINEEMTVLITTNEMLDSLGMDSKNWEAVEYITEDEINPLGDRNIVDVAERAREMAIAHHSILLQTVGLSTELANESAKKSWVQL